MIKFWEIDTKHHAYPPTETIVIGPVRSGGFHRSPRSNISTQKVPADEVVCTCGQDTTFVHPIRARDYASPAPFLHP